MSQEIKSVVKTAVFRFGFSLHRRAKKNDFKVTMWVSGSSYGQRVLKARIMIQFRDGWVSFDLYFIKCWKNENTKVKSGYCICCRIINNMIMENLQWLMRWKKTLSVSHASDSDTEDWRASLTPYCWAHHCQMY